MEELSARENLFQLWMIYTSKNDVKTLSDFIQFFIETHKELIDQGFTHLNEGFSEEGPHLTRLPDGILEVFGNQLFQCGEKIEASFSTDTVKHAKDLIQCLIVICRNYDNVPLVASCEFVSNTVTIATAVVEKLCSTSNHGDGEDEDETALTSFIEHVLHFFECLYDPYFVWRKRLRGWKVDKSRLRFKPALLHVEVVPFFHECFQKRGLTTDIQLTLLHLFGAIMSGTQHNALKAITPATLDVLLKIIGREQTQRPTNEQRHDMLSLRDMVLKCIVRMVHVIHCCSPDQRQVEVGQVMEGYLHVLLRKEAEPAGDEEIQQQLTMIGAVNEMMACRDKGALQVLLVSGGTFDAFISLLQKTPLTGSDAQTLAMSVLEVMNAVLSGSPSAKEKFQDKVGYLKLVDSLKSLGQPSMELLRTVLGLVVEGEFTEGTQHKVRNTDAGLMLIQWLPDIQSHQLQIWLSENLYHLCSHGNHNRMSCCSGGMIGAILHALNREKQINAKAVCHLINLLESLGTYSITASELKRLISLMRLDEEYKQNVYCSRLMSALSTMARRDGKEAALHYFYLQDPADGVLLSQGLKKWPGGGFSFHTWICLDTNIDVSQQNVVDPQLYRRQLYLLSTSSGSGFEAFFTPDCTLVVAIFNKKEFSSVSVSDVQLKDQCWHCIDVVHTSSRRPFGHSQVSVYIDGRQRINAQFKYPSLTEPMSLCRVGSPGLRNVVDPEQLVPPMSPTAPEAKGTKLPFKGFFQSSAKSIVASHPGVSNLPGGTQDDIWGPPIPLVGQMGSVCIFSEPIQETQVKKLFTLGPNHLQVFGQEGELSDLSGKLVLHYNAKACKDSLCLDLSPQGNHGRIVGKLWLTWDIKDIINCIGGIQVLLPLLEQVDKSPASTPLNGDTEDGEYLPPVTGEVQDDWVVIPSSSYADAKLEQNQVAGFLTLLRNMLQTSAVNQDSFLHTNCAATIGALLQQVNPKLIDVNVLMAVQLLVLASAADNKAILHSLYQYVLFDFRIWSKSEFPVRIGHIQYLSTLIKDDRKFFRKKYGVQYILDVIRSYYSSANKENGLSPEDCRTIRGSLFGLIRYYIIKDITFEELSHIIGFLVAIKEEDLMVEVSDMLIGVMEKRGKQDQLFLLLFEPEMADLLYGLLITRDYSVTLREKVLKVLHLLLSTDKVYEKSKGRLRLSDIGYSGLISLMHGCQISSTMIKLFIEQVSLTDTAHSYNAVLSVLQLIPYLSVDIKLEACRQVLSLLVSKPSASKMIARQLGWQETLTSMFILHSNTVNNAGGQGSVFNRMEYSNGLSQILENPEGADCDKSNSVNARQGGVTSVSDTRSCPGANCSNNADAGSSGVLENGSCPLDIPGAGGDSVNFHLACDEPNGDSLSRTPSTPLYLSANNFYDFNMAGDRSSYDRSRSMSRSSSASIEDLSNHGYRNSISSQSLSSVPGSDSVTDLSSTNETESPVQRRASMVQAENFQKALDNLGIQKIYVKDALEKSEELCQSLLIILLTVMWKGVDGSDRSAWKERGQVLECLNVISKNNELLRPKNEIKRRLVEMMLHSSTSDVRDAGQANAVCTENAIVLTKIVHNFMVAGSTDCENKYSDRLIEDIMTLFDILCVWETSSGTEWTEMVHMGLSILLLFAKQQNLELCAVATAKLHQLVQTRVFSNSAEACYLIGSLNTILMQAMQDNTDNYSFLIPVMKALLGRASTLLNMEVQLPSLPATTRSPTFFDDFKMYAQSEEWRTFMESQVEPQLHLFHVTHFEKSRMAMEEFWADCHEAMNINFHRRNCEMGESKLKFQDQIMEPFSRRSSQEQKRYQNVATQQRNQNEAVGRQWRATRRFFKSEQGAWEERDSQGGANWKLSNHENFSRMKVKLVQNYNYDPHEDASKLRDNQEMKDNGSEERLQSEYMAVSKEAKVARANLGDDVLGDEDWNVISSASSASEEYTDKEKLVLSEDCELVTLMEIVKGRLEVTTTHVYFFDCRTNKEEGGEDFKWALSQLREIHFRRYNLRRSALEMFLIDQTNYFLNFQKEVRNRVYSRILSLRPPNLTYYGTRSPAELLKASGLTQKWVHREISNFEYLMQLNTIAGRTYNDLSQYPVFPWVLSDYSSDTLDLEDPDIYRDLSKPIGVVNPRNEKEVKDKYDTFEDPTGMMEKFHYGTHYSNAAGVMHYMIRMEPFTTLHIELQNGRFDVADRQFHSIQSSWYSLMENPNDVKELIPEFFYLPEFLTNMNSFDLGTLQISKDRVSDVALPKWASSPEDFIFKHRKALESENVSANLHHWIDLIFGYKQKGPAAAEALNVFFYCTYEGAVDLDAITDLKQRAALEGMINNFGQTPTQLLKEPHPKRMSFKEAVDQAVKTDKPLSVLHFLKDLKTFFVEVSTDLDPLVYVNVPRSQQRSIIQHGMPDSMITVTSSGIMGVHGWLPYDRSISNYFTFQRDPSTVPSSRTKKVISGPFAPGLRIEPKLFVVSHDAKLLFSGGHWDNSLQVHHVSKGKRVSHIVRHADIVTCLALDYCGRHLISGSRDTTCIVWQVLQQKGGESIGLASKPVQTLYGHDAEITAVHISMELDLAVSAAKNGNVVLHTVRKGHFMRTLRPPCSPGRNLDIPLLLVSSSGQMVIYCQETGNPSDPQTAGVSRESDSTNQTVAVQDMFSLHLYSVNGKHLIEERLAHPLGHMTLTEEYLVLGNNQGQVIIKLLFGLETLETKSLHVPIQCLSVTHTNSHIFAGLRDGKLIIVGIKRQSGLR